MPKKERCVKIAEYMLKYKTTVRQAAEHFGMPKTTLHVDITERLKNTDRALYRKVQKLLDNNFADRNRRGGVAVYAKYGDLIYERLHTNHRKEG